MSEGLNASALGVAAAELMEEVEREYPSATLEVVCVVVEVSYLGEDGEDRTAVQWKFANPDNTAVSTAHAAGIAAVMKSCLLVGESE